ncbi:MAG TPA: putative transporter [Sutterella sp.]|nr:putative transporter [Sutterella sp.]
MLDFFSQPGSVAYTLFTYSLVIAIGMALGSVRIFGIKLGVIFVLFVGFVVDYLFASIDPSMLAFVRDFGLTFFMYFIGVQVGPSFISTLKTGGLKLNILMIGGVLLSVATALILFFAFSSHISLPETMGAYFGAVTNTPGLGAAQEVLNHLQYEGKDISIVYACAYPMGFIGLLLSIIAIKVLFKIDPAVEDAAWNRSVSKDLPIYFTVEVTNPGIVGKTIGLIRQSSQLAFIASRLKRGDLFFSPNATTVIEAGDLIMIVTEARFKDFIVAFFGKENTEVEIDEENSPIVQRTLMMTRANKIGIKVHDLHLSKFDGVNVTRIYRSGMELFPYPKMRLQFGDRLLCVGKEAAIDRLAHVLGNQARYLIPSLASIFTGILAGILFGSVPFVIPGLPVPMRLGVAGGPLIIGILIGCYGPFLRLNTYVSSSANELLRSIGMALFLASIGLNAGEKFFDALISGEATLYMIVGFVIAVFPAMAIGIFARVVLKTNFHAISGMLAGMGTNTPILSYCASLSDKNSPAIAYTTVYPMTMFLRILSGQVILIALSSFVIV